MPFEAKWYDPVTLEVTKNNKPIFLEKGFTASCSDCHMEFSLGYEDLDGDYAECDAVDISYCPFCGKEIGLRVMDGDTW